MGELSIHGARYSRAEGGRFKSIEPVRRLGRISADRIHTAAGRRREGEGNGTPE
jgi:hypothetical protein